MTNGRHQCAQPEIHSGSARGSRAGSHTDRAIFARCAAPGRQIGLVAGHGMACCARATAHLRPPRDEPNVSEPHWPTPSRPRGALRGHAERQWLFGRVAPAISTAYHAIRDPLKYGKLGRSPKQGFWGAGFVHRWICKAGFVQLDVQMLYSIKYCVQSGICSNLASARSERSPGN